MQPDSSDIEKLQEKLENARSALGALAPQVAKAKAVKEFVPVRLKDALAAAQLRFINRGESVSGAEAMARTDPLYIAARDQLESDLENAHHVLTQWDAVFAAVDIGRSILAMNRESMRNLQG